MLLLYWVFCQAYKSKLSRHSVNQDVNLAKNPQLGKYLIQIDLLCA